ncbi:CDP-glycerol glycerophosphotransferase family protein [Virgibacillus necropolis]|uniref:CDP-glycerol glycerophosphotransferase family protein n=1 Tax=Virgibacillus necropolis TaxID=163877 RepID=UPI00384A7E1E
MVREIAITVYLFVFRTLFHMFNLFPQKKKTVFVASFGDNILFTLDELEKQVNTQVIILKTSQCKINFGHTSTRKIIIFELSHLFSWIRSIYHLATADKVLVDNYFGFLAVTDFKPNVQCIQLWHAVGAIKQFSLKDPTVKNRTERANARFKKVYRRFTHIVVGSEKMIPIFHESFGVSKRVFLRTGVPRTDFFYETAKMHEVEQNLKSTFPITKRKKVILYAPTYRDQELDRMKIELDIKKLEAQLSDEYVLFLRLHPAVKHKYKDADSNFVYDVTHIADLNQLLVITDILITDYSSIPFEFSMLQRPIVFFAYDLEEYNENVGFWEDYETLVPGPVVRNTDDLLETIAENKFDLQQVKEFADEWNQYSKGNSSEKLVKALYNEGPNTN